MYRDILDSQYLESKISLILRSRGVIKKTKMDISFLKRVVYSIIRRLVMAFHNHT
jgi:hypothetical protein